MSRAPPNWQVCTDSVGHSYSGQAVDESDMAHGVSESCKAWEYGEIGYMAQNPHHQDIECVWLVHRN
jgi:hypothetical protein